MVRQGMSSLSPRPELHVQDGARAIAAADVPRPQPHAVLAVVHRCPPPRHEHDFRLVAGGRGQPEPGGNPREAGIAHKLKETTTWIGSIAADLTEQAVAITVALALVQRDRPELPVQQV